MLVFTGVFALFVFKPVSLDHLMLNGAAGLMRGIATIFVVNAARHLPFGSYFWLSSLCANIWWSFSGLFYFL